jgi:D-glycero-D-manno-heptose 1,7-bisphosphate phosphatase
VVANFQNKAIFLDRDGILNKAIIKNNKPKSPQNFDELILNKFLKNILLKLKKKYFLICITNQPEVGRKNFLKKEVNKINSYIKEYFNLDDVFSCFHKKDGICNCRKPKIGMILKAQKKYSLNLKKSIIIGDRWRDIAMGKIAGCKTIFIDYKYNEVAIERPDVKLNNLKELNNNVLFQ